MHLGLTYTLQTNPHDERQAEWDPPGALEAVSGALQELGHRVRRLGSAEDLLAQPHLLDGIELVFNLAEGRHGRCREAWVPTLLEAWGIPWVGSDALALAMGLDKAVCKRLAVAAGIATPPWISVDHPDQLPDDVPLPFPAIVKPRWQGSGIGIDAGAVVRTPAELRGRVRALYARWPEPVLIETFIETGELTVLIIGNEPPLAYPPVQRPLDPATRLAYHVVHRNTDGPWEAPLALTPALEREAQHIATTMFAALGCRDVARVDLRVDAQGRSQFLEINPLPSYDPDGTIGLIAQHLGLAYRDLIGRVLDVACARTAASSRLEPA